ncbi:MAG: hypothetical protein DRJ50_14295 [Actinobacteria bacterium]|nr:MAG: hypothetical protein DRJ50_14295 [Actinomycetota bacterium]
MPDHAAGARAALSKLGLPLQANAAEINSARRRLAQEHHPDVGGDPTLMQEINAAAATALRSVEVHEPTDSSEEPWRAPSPSKSTDDWAGVTRDVASFTVEALPVEAFEGLLVAAASMGVLIDDDPPYRLDVDLEDPIRCWCRLDVVPDAGSSTVSLTIGAVGAQGENEAPPSVDVVRDVWVDALNQLDWT